MQEGRSTASKRSCTPAARAAAPTRP